MKRYCVMTSTHTSEVPDGPFVLISDVSANLKKWLTRLTEVEDDGTLEGVYEVIRSMTDELADAMIHHSTGQRTRAEVISEIADVVIMCAQMRFLFGQREVDAMIDQKMKRLEERLK